MTPANTDESHPWTPVVEERDDVVTDAAAVALHGLLDATGSAPRAGDALPPLWHWLAFLPTVPQKDIGDDGHPRLGDFLPETGLSRRMFAGGRFDFSRGAVVNEPLHRHSMVTSVSEKSGRSGKLVFVEVTHTLFANEQEYVTEVQDLVYRGPSATSPSTQSLANAPDDLASDIRWTWRRQLSTDPTLLFRFSALTYNAHRIHYDRAYATNVEGYPGLVVHGPLQAIALVELCRSHIPDRQIVHFEYRALRPAFDGPSLELRGRYVDDDTVELVAVDDTGRPTMTANSTLYPRAD